MKTKVIKNSSISSYQHFKLMFMNDLKHLLVNRSLWIVTPIVIGIILFMLVIFPIATSDFASFFQTSEWNIYSIPVIYAMLAFFSAFIGDINCNLSERVYILSKPISRKLYFLSKLCSTLVYTAAFFVLVLLILIFINCSFIVKGQATIFRKSNDFVGIFFSLLTMIIFGSVTGILFKFRMKGIVGSIVCLLLVCVYIIACFVGFNLNQTSGDTPEIIWFTSRGIIIVFLPATVVIGAIFLGLFYKERILA